ncbi:IclR family transcriptional regulator [Streptosporangium sp. CA-115845]|uniref:IclR family transcriptional regulator n=1 Tax=Streptosporangium sp. CA-115845 TaxID=3240071 RepID=UPI003D902A92
MADTKALSSVNRALTMIELLAESSGLTVTQLADRLGTGKATAFRLAKTLVDRGWLVKDADLHYRLGPGILGLSPSTQAKHDLKATLRPILEELHDATKETVHLTELHGRHIIYLEQLVSPKPVRSVSTLGSRSPAHCVSPGLALMAALPAETLNWILAVPLQRYTERSMTDQAEIREELSQVRARGYAINRGSYRPEVGGVGVAVVDARRRPIAGISVCMPSYRMQTADLAEIGRRLIDAAADAQRRITLARIA